jgi:hypothetical protein
MNPLATLHASDRAPDVNMRRRPIFRVLPANHCPASIFPTSAGMSTKTKRVSTSYPVSQPDYIRNVGDVVTAHEECVNENQAGDDRNKGADTVRNPYVHVSHYSGWLPRPMLGNPRDWLGGIRLRHPEKGS